MDEIKDIEKIKKELIPFRVFASFIIMGFAIMYLGFIQRADKIELVNGWTVLFIIFFSLNIYLLTPDFETRFGASFLDNIMMSST